MKSRPIKKQAATEEQKAYCKAYYAANREKMKADRREKYANMTPEEKKKISLVSNAWRTANPVKYKQYLADRWSDREEYRKYYREYQKNRRSSNLLVRLNGILNSSITLCLKNIGKKKSKRTEEILGCTFLEFKSYIESKWEPWMSWENYGKYNGELNYGWDLDHIIPTNIATNVTEIEALNYYTNLQPLCSYVNRYVKGAKW